MSSFGWITFTSQVLPGNRVTLTLTGLGIVAQGSSVDEALANALLVYSDKLRRNNERIYSFD
jgi:ribosomal protein S9